MPITIEDAFASLDLAAIITDTDLRVLAANQAGRSLLGVDEAVGRTLTEMMGSDVDVGMALDMQPIRTVDGRRGFVALGRSGDDPSKPVGELRRQFLRTVSHELRTPLTSVIGYAETLRAHHRSFDEDRLDDLLGRLVRNALSLHGLMDDLLDVDRLSRRSLSLELREVDVSRAVLRVVELKARPGRLRAAVERVTAVVDVGKIERITDNLIANAVKHAGAGATAWVRLDVDGPDVLLVVEDDGIGIDPADRERVFLPFEQGVASRTDASPGSGIGLNLVRELARLHGGDVTLHTRDGGGLRVEVRLPLVGPPSGH